MPSTPITLGPFLLDTVVASGGMGQIWRGIHQEHQVQVAIKVVRPSRTRRPVYVEAVEREVRAVARLHHTACPTPTLAVSCIEISSPPTSSRSANENGRWQRHNLACAAMVGVLCGSEDTVERLASYGFAAQNWPRASEALLAAARVRWRQMRVYETLDLLDRWDIALKQQAITATDARRLSGLLLRAKVTSRIGSSDQAIELTERSERLAAAHELSVQRADALNLRGRIITNLGRAAARRDRRRRPRRRLGHRAGRSAGAPGGPDCRGQGRPHPRRPSLARAGP